jgi:hypothetical protein
MRYGFALLAAGLLSTGCDATIKATAPNVANPVLLGPVDRVGGHRASDAAPVGAFSVVLQDSTAAIALPYVTVNAVTLGHDPKNVTYAVLLATHADPSLDAHVESVTAEGSCLFALYYASCSESSALAGRVTKHAPMDAAPTRTVGSTTPPAAGSIPPPAAGSIPPPLTGSTPPPAAGSTTPPAAGAMPPPAAGVTP